MSRISFLNPPLSLEELYEDLAEGGSELPPLGLATLAAVAEKAGHQCCIVDSIALKYDYETTADKLLEFNPNIVAITSTTISIMNVQDVCHILRKRGFGGKILIGGPHFTAVPDATMNRMPVFDIGCYGEGEDTLADLLEALDTGRDLSTVDGVLYREDDVVIKTRPRKLINDLDRIPFPAYHLLPDLKSFYQPAVDSLHRFPASSMVTSRGCPGQCVFCDRSVYGNRVRGFSARYVADMMKHLRYEYGIKDVFIHDDNFVVLRKRLRELCDIIINEKIDITWSALGRVDNMDIEALDMMKEAGCWQVNLGIESGSQRILDIMAKQIDSKDAEKTIHAIRAHGIRVKGLFIIGNFGETHETVAETLAFIKRVKMDDFHMTCFNPFPGSEAFFMAPQYGWFDPDWSKMNMFNPDNFVPKDLTREELVYYHRLAYRTFYLRPYIFWYYFKKLKNPQMAKKVLRGGWAFLKFTLKKLRKPSRHDVERTLPQTVSSPGTSLS